MIVIPTGFGGDGLHERRICKVAIRNGVHGDLVRAAGLRFREWIGTDIGLAIGQQNDRAGSMRTGFWRVN